MSVGTLAKQTVNRSITELEVQMVRTGCVLFAAALALAACGSTMEERGISGAGIGAGAGAVVGAVTGLSIAQGALIGAAAGGLTGILTDKEQIDLGEPVWKKTSANSEMLRNMQVGLSKLGFDPGPADGKNGPKTRDAIRQYQKKHNLLVDGQASKELARHIQQKVDKLKG